METGSIWSHNVTDTVREADVLGWRGTFSLLILNSIALLIVLLIFWLGRSGTQQLFCFGRGKAGVPGRTLATRCRKFLKQSLHESDILERCGSEGRNYLLFEWYTTLLFLFMSCVVCSVLLPLNIAVAYSQGKNWQWFSSWSVRQIPGQSSLFWVVILVFYICTAALIVYLKKLDDVTQLTPTLESLALLVDNVKGTDDELRQVDHIL